MREKEEEPRQLRELQEQLRERHAMEARQLREPHELDLGALDENLALEARHARERLEALLAPSRPRRNRENRVRERRAARNQTDRERRERVEALTGAHIYSRRSSQEGWYLTSDAELSGRG